MGQLMNSQKKPVSVRIPTETDDIPKVLDFYAGLFAKVWVGLKEPPVMEKQQDLQAGRLCPTQPE